jgi:hypothetical protein
MRLKNIALKLKNRHHCDVHYCWELRTLSTQGKSVLYHKQSTLLNKRSWKNTATSGISDEPLLGLTIGEAFEETVSRFPKNEAVVSKHQNIRYTYEQLEIQ